MQRIVSYADHVISVQAPQGWQTLTAASGSMWILSITDLPDGPEIMLTFGYTSSNVGEVMLVATHEGEPLYYCYQALGGRPGDWPMQAMADWANCKLEELTDAYNLNPGDNGSAVAARMRDWRKATAQ